MVIDHGNVYGVRVPLLHLSKIPCCYRRYVRTYIHTNRHMISNCVQIYCITLTAQFVNISKRCQH